MQGHRGIAGWPDLGRERRTGKGITNYLHMSDRRPNMGMPLPSDRRRPPTGGRGPRRVGHEYWSWTTIHRCLRIVREALPESGLVPIVTGDLDEVPHLLEHHRPSLVLMDLVLPGVDGVEVMAGILEKTDVPVIFLSRLRSRGSDNPCARRGGRRLYRQTLLANRAGGQDQGGLERADGTRQGPAAGATCVRRSEH